MLVTLNGGHDFAMWEILFANALVWLASASAGQLDKSQNEGGGPEGPPQFALGTWTYWTTVMSTFSTHSGKKTGSRFDQPGAVAAASLIDWSKVRRRSG